LLLGVIQNSHTSVQALQLLHSLCDELFVYHNESQGTEFHPKAYAFERIDEEAILFVGSNNLTAGGLYTNYETSALLRLNLHDERDGTIFEDFIDMFNFYITPSEHSREVTPDFIQELVDGNYLLDETTERGGREGGDGHPPQQRIFGATTFHAPPLPLQRAELKWRKENLPSSDVQYVSPGTNPTGCLRLNQARFEVNGRRIDQTVYFRNDVFRDFDWILVKGDQEATEVLFTITILGQHIGRYRLRVTHQPSAEARQNNVTTLIHWGEVSQYLGRQELVGRTLNLYAPPRGQQEPFHIEIV